MSKHLARLTEVLAVFSAAGWKTDTALDAPGAHYRFEAVPGALGVAIPSTYDGALFVSGRRGG